MKAGEFARRAARIERSRGPAFRRKAMRALVKRAGAAMIVPRGRLIGYRMPDGAVVCLKERFATVQDAHAELGRIRATSAHAYIPLRAYACEWCGAVHLTSRA